MIVVLKLLGALVYYRCDLISYSLTWKEEQREERKIGRKVERRF